MLLVLFINNINGLYVSCPIKNHSFYYRVKVTRNIRQANRVFSASVFDVIFRRL
jgi:hypothetical protein